PFPNEISKWLALVLCFVIALVAPKLGAKKLQRLEGAISRFALHRRQAVLFCAVLPVLARVALLPIFGIPEPVIADEFGYLLVANTLASGRLTNPAHALWKFFEAIYVLHQPTYTSIYPIAPAILLAIPEIFGANPWLGVCFGVGLMCGLICWMLQGWVPPKWALLGGVLAVARFSIINPWMNTYWGGTTAAIGGALLVGAAPRIMKYCRLRDSVLFGMGVVILCHSRPYEGLLFSIPMLVWLAIWVIRERHIPFDLRLRRVVVPVSAVLILLAAGTAYYNWRVTGDPLMMPYVLHQRVYGTPQHFYFQPAIQDAPATHRQKDLADVFQWQLDAHEGRLPENDELSRLLVFWRFYLGPLYTIPLLFLPFLWRDSRLRILLLATVLLLAGNRLYPFFFPHYAAPVCGLMILFVIQGLRSLRVVRAGSHAIGLPASRGLILLAGLSGVCAVAGGSLTPWVVTATNTPRSKVVEQLKAGKHVVMVRYSADHSFHYGVVFNDADIDASRIVWARDLGDAANKEIKHYYRDRQFWQYNPDLAPDALAPMTGQPYFSAAVDGAGRRDDPRDGLCPGGIAVLFGGNLAPDLHASTISHTLGLLPVHLSGISAEFGDEFSPGTSVAKAEPPADISVQFGDYFAPILGVSHFGNQEAITLQVPFETQPGLVTVKLRRGDLMWPKKVRVLPLAPGVFQMRMSDSKLRGIVLRPDGSFVDLEHPAHRGEILRYFVNGIGGFKPPVRTGETGTSLAVAEPALALIVGVAGRAAPMLSAKYAAGMVGVTEIAFQVPLETPSGNDINLSIAAVVDGQPVYSNKSLIPVR
ncbi:MAG: hypothetical protein JO307_14100, partial [Bryobacterales bacterium]|nr:hypothetical protein [Bryobacterales bacterium]